MNTKRAVSAGYLRGTAGRTESYVHIARWVATHFWQRDCGVSMTRYPRPSRVRSQEASSIDDSTRIHSTDAMSCSHPDPVRSAPWSIRVGPVTSPVIANMMRVTLVQQVEENFPWRLTDARFLIRLISSANSYGLSIVVIGCCDLLRYSERRQVSRRHPLKPRANRPDARRDALSLARSTLPNELRGN